MHSLIGFKVIDELEKKEENTNLVEEKDWSTLEPNSWLVFVIVWEPKITLWIVREFLFLMRILMSWKYRRLLTEKYV